MEGRERVNEEFENASMIPLPHSPLSLSLSACVCVRVWMRKPCEYVSKCVGEGGNGWEKKGFLLFLTIRSDI